MSETQLRELFSRHPGGAEPPLPAGFVARSVAAGRRRSRRRRVTRAMVVGVAAVAAVAVGATVLPGGDRREHVPGQQAPADPRTEGLAGPSSPGPVEQSSAGPAEPRDVAALLQRASLAAGQRTLDVRDDRFIYEKRWFVARFPTPINGRSEVAGNSELWRSVDGRRPGWVISVDKLGQQYGAESPVVSRPSLLEPTYRYLATLPTDVDALMARLRAEIEGRRVTRPGDAADVDQGVFTLIGDLLNSTMVPPKLGAALFQVAARIPGVTMVPDLADAAGRPGIGVRRISTVAVGRSEWIFQKGTYEFLGANVDDGPQSGGVSYAVLVRAVVDGVRQVP